MTPAPESSAVDRASGGEFDSVKLGNDVSQAAQEDNRAIIPRRRPPPRLERILIPAFHGGLDRPV